MKRVVATFAATALLSIFVFFAFFWNDVATSTVNAQLAPHGVRIENGIHGAFPFHFKVPEITVPHGVKVKNLAVDYEGTYNPFKLVTQTGDIVQATATLQVAVKENLEVDVDVEHFYVERTDGTNAWFFSTRLRLFDQVVDATFEFVPDVADTYHLHVDIDDVAIDLYSNSLLVAYMEHEVLHLSLTDNLRPMEHFSLDLATVAHIIGDVLVSHNDIKWTDVFITFFDHVPVDIPALQLVNLNWHDSTVNFKIDDFLSLSVKDGNIVVGNIRTRGRDWAQLMAVHTFALETTNPSLRFTPPIDTPLGPVRSMDVLVDRTTLRVNVGNTPITLSPRGLQYGPIALLIGDDRLALEIDGGTFQSFSCTYLHAFVKYASPDVLVLQNATAHQWDEVIHGSGTYNIATRKAAVELKLNRR